MSDTSAAYTWLRALRVNQWTKNGIVFAAFFFAFGDSAVPVGFDVFWKVVAAAALFSLLSSAIYLINDMRDIEADRAHPIKKNRPIASGAVPISAARGVAAFLMLFTLAAGAALNLDLHFFVVLALYLVLQIAYTFYLKRIPLLDVFIIAFGFVLRALAGGEVIDVPISRWLVLCTLFLALFLALCKRRHEKVVEVQTAGASRPALKGYNAKLLDILIGLVSLATIIGYTLYTQDTDTVVKFNTRALAFTVPFVVFGIGRYLVLVYRHQSGGRPEKVLLTDLPLIIDLLLYATTVGLIIWHG